MSRLAQLSADDLGGEARAAFERIVADRTAENATGDRAAVYGGRTAANRNALAGPFNVWMRSPGLAEHTTGLANFLRYRSTLEPRVMELAILIVAQRYGADYAWSNHEGYAEKSGLSRDCISALGVGQRPDLANAEDDAAYDLVRELLDTRSVSDTTYDAALSHFAEAGTVELVTLVGYYVMIALSLNAFRVPAPAGAVPPFRR